jgi:hypothetical protein
MKVSLETFGCALGCIDFELFLGNKDPRAEMVVKFFLQKVTFEVFLCALTKKLICTINFCLQ